MPTTGGGDWEKHMMDVITQKSYQAGVNAATAAAAKQIHQQNMYMQQISLSNGTGSLTTTGSTKKKNYGFDTNKDEKVDWAKFAMWLRGFLSAIEGQPLTPESVGKIMDKLAYVDPDKKLSYAPDDDFAEALRRLQYNPPAYPQPIRAQPTWVSPNTSGGTAGNGNWQNAQLAHDPSWKISLDAGDLKNAIAQIYNANIHSPNLNSIKLSNQLESKLNAAAAAVH